MELARLGFHYRVRQPSLVASYYATAGSGGLFTQSQYDANYASGRNEVINSPKTYNLYKLDQVQALHADAPLLTRAGDGSFKLMIGIQKATLGETFSAFSFTPTGTTINANGKVEFNFTVPDSAAFFRVEAR